MHGPDQFVQLTAYVLDSMRLTTWLSCICQALVGFTVDVTALWLQGGTSEGQIGRDNREIFAACSGKIYIGSFSILSAQCCLLTSCWQSMGVSKDAAPSAAVVRMQCRFWPQGLLSKSKEVHFMFSLRLSGVQRSSPGFHLFWSWVMLAILSSEMWFDSCYL